MQQKMHMPFIRLSVLFASAWQLILTIGGAELQLIGTHPTSRLSGFPAIHTLKAFKEKIYLGYGDWTGLNFPAVTIASYQPGAHTFAIEFSAATDSIELFRDLNGVLYAVSIDPGFNEENRDYSYLAEKGWRESSPVGMYHVFDMGSADGSDLWMAGSKPVNTLSSSAAVFRSTDGGRNWEDLTIPTTLARYYWGFPLRGRFYVRDTYYEGRNATRTAQVRYIGLRKSTLIGNGSDAFIIGAGTTIDPDSEARGTPRPLVTFDSQSWRTLRTGVLDFTVQGSNLFTLESRSVWLASSLTATQALWQRLDFTNVPSDARAIEVADRVVFVGDGSGRLWAGHLDGGSLPADQASVVNHVHDSFGGAVVFDGDSVAIGAPDHSGGLPLTGQVSIWERQTDSHWQRTAVIDPPSPSFSGWFGKDLAMEGDLLAIVEAGRDSSRTLRGRSAQVHLYERSVQNWQWRTNLNLPFAQSVAIHSGWLAVGAGSAVEVEENRLHLYRLNRGPTGIEAKRGTNLTVRTPQHFWKPMARIALEGDICVLASTGDASYAGPGEVRIYQRDGGEVWRLQQVIRAYSNALSGNWAYNAAPGAWQVHGATNRAGSAITTRLSSPTITVDRAGAVQLSFNHRWNFEPAYEGGQVRVSMNDGPYSPIPVTAFNENGYNGAIHIESVSELFGQGGFINQSAGHASGDRLKSTCNIGFLNAGDTVSFEFLYAGNWTTNIGKTPNWEVDSLTLTQALTDGGSPQNILKAEDFDTSDGGFKVETVSPWGPDRFGSSVALRDGWLAVGAPRDDRAALQAGAIYLYQRTNTPAGTASFAHRQTIVSPIAQAEAAYGASVALHSSALLVGAPGTDLQGTRQHGATFVYNHDGTMWRHVGQITAPEASEGEFGTRVSLGSQWFAASSRFSSSSTDLAARVAIHPRRLPAGELKGQKQFENGQFGLIVSGEIGRTYDLQATSDMASGGWADLMRFLLTTPTTNLLDSGAAELPRRYYRLSSRPVE